MSRRIFFILFYLLYCLNALSKNFPASNFERNFPDPLLALRIDELESLDTIIYLSFSNGIVLYNPTLEEWSKFHNIERYEKYGMIKEIYKFNNHLFIVLENATIIKKPQTKKKTLIYISLLKLFLKNNQVFSLAFDTIYNLKYISGVCQTIQLPERKIGAKYPLVEQYNYVFNYNLQNEVISLTKTSFSVNPACCHTLEFFEDEFWISSSLCPYDYMNFRISLNGDVHELNGNNEYPVPIQLFKSFNDTLLIFTDSTLYKYKDDKWITTPFIFKVFVPDYGQFLTFSYVKSCHALKDSLMVFSTYYNQSEVYFVNFLKSTLDTISLPTPFDCGNCIENIIFLKNYFFALFSTQNYVVRYDADILVNRRLFSIKDSLDK